MVAIDHSEGLGEVKRARAGLPASTPAVRLGGALALAVAVIVLSTIWFLPSPGSVRSVALIELSVLVATVVAVLVLAKTEEGSPWLLVFPAIIVAAQVSVASVFPAAGLAYTGFFTLSFIYVGLSMHRGVSLVILPPAAAAWFYCQTTPVGETVVRAFITFSVWLLIGELLAARTSILAGRIGQLVDASHTDELTGVGNRGSLTLALSRLKAEDAVIVIDLDHFKSVNDSLGHAGGDTLLREFAHSLRSNVRAADQVYRYGGEEFVVILSNGEGRVDAATLFLERLASWWAQLSLTTFSAGVAVHMKGSPAETFERADAAMYEAKRGGRNRWHVDPASRPV